MTDTELILVALNEGPVVPLSEICKMYFGLSIDEARRQAALNLLPIPTWRASVSRQGPLLVHVSALAELIDEKAGKARDSWERSQI